jgi:hypothetical protein
MQQLYLGVHGRTKTPPCMNIQRYLKFSILNLVWYHDDMYPGIARMRPWKHRWVLGSEYGSTRGGDNILWPPGTTPLGHHHTSSASPPRCLARCEWNFPRSFITTRKSARRALERFSANPIAVPQPFLGRSGAENGGKLGFWAAARWFLTLHDLERVLARCNGLETHLKLRVLVLVRSSSWFGDKY